MITEQVLGRYSHFDLLLFLPDADGKDRSAEFQGLMRAAEDRNVKLICCAARQEVEVWLLAGHAGKLGKHWPEIAADVSAKENVFDPFLEKYGDRRRAGGGRDLLMDETLRNYSGLLQRCPELAELQKRTMSMLGTLQGQVESSSCLPCNSFANTNVL